MLILKELDIIESRGALRSIPEGSGYLPSVQPALELSEEVD